jgi:glutamyl-tRNA reductase
MSALSARYLVNRGAREVRIINRTYEHAQELARAVRGTAAHSEELGRCLAEADILISATACPHFILSRDEAESVAGKRGNRPLVVVDIAMPRDVDPSVHEVRGLFFYDLDDLERCARYHAGERCPPQHRSGTSNSRSRPTRHTPVQPITRRVCNHNWGTPANSV